MKQNRLLLFANDAASANSVIAYAKLYGDQFSSIKAYYGCDVAKKLYEKYIPNFICQSEISFLKTDLVVTGTSGIDSSYELNIIKKATNCVKKIICIVDNISNFNMRFTIDDKILEKDFLPNEIWVYNKDFKCNISYINEKIVYKENIYLKFLQKSYENKKPELKNVFVKKNQFKYLVFISEYVYELYGLEFGFCEYDILENLLSSIEKLNLNIPIFIKLHPREHKNKFNILLRKYNHLYIVCEDCDIQELIYYSKVVFGINSSVFMESKLFKKDTYSLQINSKKQMNVNMIDEENIIKNQETLENILSLIYNI